MRATVQLKARIRSESNRRGLDGFWITSGGQAKLILIEALAGYVSLRPIERSASVKGLSASILRALFLLWRFATVHTEGYEPPGISGIPASSATTGDLL